MSDRDRAEAYAAALHDVVGALATVRQLAANALDGIGAAEELLADIIAVTEGKLERARVAGDLERRAVVLVPLTPSQARSLVTAADEKSAAVDPAGSSHHLLRAASERVRVVLGSG